jgi:DNA-binding NarL/FixJ family response regulator
LRSRSSTIAGHSSFLSALFPEAEESFADARATALDDRDETEAIHGLALAKIMGERGDAQEAVALLLARRYESPTHLLRAATAELTRRRFGEGIAGSLEIHEAQHALPQVEDPRVRSAFTYQVAYTLGQKAQYHDASEWLTLLMRDVKEYDLEFARPHAAWTSALIKLGLRRFGETERLLQSLEDVVAATHDTALLLNARLLRARLLLQSGKSREAVELMADPPGGRVFPSWLAEHAATRALALACSTQDEEALREAASAEALSRCAEARVMAAAARAIVGARRGNVEAASRVLTTANSLGVWDPVVSALRASRELSDVLASSPQSRKTLESLYATSNDLGLARRAGFRTRATRAPEEVLTPRESDVLELIARGMKTRDIAEALYISPSTAKVHVTHVFEKLGVHTRAEALIRYKMFEDDD